MKKYLLLLLIFALSTKSLLAKPIEDHEAKNVALNYLHKKALNSKKIKTKKFKVKTVSSDRKILKKLFTKKGFEVDHPTFRLVELEPQGWVLVAGDDTDEPIIGYSIAENEKFDPDNLPPQLEELLDERAKAVKTNRVKNIKAKPNQEWKKFAKETDEFEAEINEELVMDATSSVPQTDWRLPKDVSIVTPLWDQCRFYNALTPSDTRSVCRNNRVPTGCNATTVAMLTRYHRWPSKAVNLTAYTDDNRFGMEDRYGLIAVQNNNHIYNWNSMPTSNLINNNADVAILMHHAGIAHKIDYGYQATAAAGVFDTNNALVNNFGYTSYGSISKSNYSNRYDWYQKIKTDLRQGYPVAYTGSGDKGGHIFLIDGFDVDGDEFSINWGWGGYSNGYYRLESLTPLDFNFNSNQYAIFGIKPNNLNDIYENDNTWETSTWMSIGGLDGRKNKHSINPVNDEDWVNFWNPTTKTVTIETLNSSGDTRLWLYDRYGKQVAYNDNVGTSKLSKISTLLPSGTYYIKVGGNGINTISSYDLVIR